MRGFAKKVWLGGGQKLFRKKLKLDDFEAVELEQQSNYPDIRQPRMEDNLARGY